ncbi:hypothetical protein GCM10027046_34350 [Uliginosibacterium flavum]|uniref:F0F1 ATP synthase subunit gamma n=1 Tax=Uliginosibacterium flavum TaxID=1396831 RepID=A0ABV2TMJ6_9RHOO
MSRRREFARRLEALTEIAGIMSAMKALALMETRILRDFLDCQQGMLASIETAAADFLAWHPEFAATPEAGPELYVLLGSEQGFCGDYNEVLLSWLRAQAPGASAQHIVVGQRMAARLNDKSVQLAGASVADEVPAVLQALSAQLRQWLSAHPGAGLSVLYHCEASGSLRLRRLLPLGDLPAPAPTPWPADLNLAPAEFFAALSGHYLYAALNAVLYSALMTENRQRLAHMENALHKLDEDRLRLQRQANAQRQEDITEEIEIIQLSAQMLAGTGS